LREAIIEEVPYPVKGAYVQCSNPLLAYADSRMTFNAINKLDFFVVADIFMTPTASLADIVLPVATQFEFNDIGHYGLGHGYILARPKIVDPPEECWSDIRILNALGRAMTPEEYWFDDPNDLLAALLKPSGLSYPEFAEQGLSERGRQIQEIRIARFQNAYRKGGTLSQYQRKIQSSAIT